MNARMTLNRRDLIRGAGIAAAAGIATKAAWAASAPAAAAGNSFLHTYAARRSTA